MAFIKGSNPENMGKFYFLFSFILILSGQTLLGVCFLIMGWLQGWGQQARVWNGKTERAEVTYAGFWLRVGSGFSDLFFRFFLFILLYFVLDQKFINFLGESLYLIAYLLVEMVTLKSFGQTPGNMMMGIRVVKTDFSELSWLEIFLRLSVKILLNLRTLLTALLIMGGTITPALMDAHSNPPDDFYKNLSERLSHLAEFWSLSEFIILLTNRRKRGLQDFLAGTVVVKTPAENRPRALWLGSFFLLASVVTVCFMFLCSLPILNIKCGYGDPSAQRVLGSLYFRGWVVKQDYNQSSQWYQKAAAQGDNDAQERLGEIYEKGLGVPADQAQAIQWYTQAAQNGSWIARGRLKRLGIIFHKIDKKP